MLFLFLSARRPDRELLLVGAFACFGFGLITRISMVLPVATAIVYVLLSRSLRTKIMRVGSIVVATLAPFVCWQLYYNHLRTGNALISPVQTAQYAVNNGLGGNLLVGVTGLLISPGKSVFVYCPIALLSLMVMGQFWTLYRNEAVFVSLLAVQWLLLHAKLQSWYGTWGWGPRHFVTIAPALALPFLVVRLNHRGRIFKAFAIVLLGWGLLLAVASQIGNPHYRLMLAYQAGLLKRETFVWSLTRNQAADALVAAAQNLTRTFCGGDYEIVAGASKIDIIASNTVNLWFVTACRLGIPARYVTVAVTMLVGCAAMCLWMLFRRTGGLPPDSGIANPVPEFQRAGSPDFP
jgi:hypothetical protein